MSEWVEKKCVEFRKEARKRAIKMAKETNKNLIKEFKSVVDRFYRTYTPHYYVRHHVRGKNTKGMMRTAIFLGGSGVAEKADKTAVYTQMRFATDFMYNDYSKNQSDKTKQYVLDSFLDGWHGPPNVVRLRAIFPYEHMKKYCNSLINDLQSRCSVK